MQEIIIEIIASIIAAILFWSQYVAIAGSSNAIPWTRTMQYTRAPWHSGDDIGRI